MTGQATPQADPAIAADYLTKLAPHGRAAAEDRPAPWVDPRLAGFRMPAEWEPHERTLLTWPTRAALWRGAFAEAKREFAAVVRAIADYEQVTVIAQPGDSAEVRDHCGTSNIEVFTSAVDDSWIRDNGPLIVCGENGKRLGVDFVFNSWGEKFTPYDSDAGLAARVLEHLGIERVAVDMVLEGGAITVDGDGTLITTAQCVLHSNRNPGLSQSAVEETLRAALGVQEVVMLPFGHLDDRHTDGHVDGVCTFTAPGRVLAQVVADPHSVNHEAMARNLRHLRDHPDARGRRIDVLGLDLSSTFQMEGITESVSYANFYIANGVVIVPTSGSTEEDEAALELLGAEFIGRDIRPVDGRVIAFGGGGPHCITMQVPAPTLPG